MATVQVDWGVSERRACEVLCINRSACQYRSRRPRQVALETRIREICETRVRYGYRRVHIQLLREGRAVNHKKVHRIYSELGMQLRNKAPKRRVKARLREYRREARSFRPVASGSWTKSIVQVSFAEVARASHSR